MENVCSVKLPCNGIWVYSVPIEYILLEIFAFTLNMYNSGREMVHIVY